MVFEFLKLHKNVTDTEFDTIYPENIKRLAAIHWTPVAVAMEAAEFLADIPDAKVLDIGSGVGKFCLVGASMTKGSFTGVELRGNLHRIANDMIRYYCLQNVKFINSNITEINFKDYNAFYYFNPFYENLEKTNLIDENVELKTQNFNVYNRYVKEQLDDMPIGTRLVTYWSSFKDIPRSYHVQSKSFGGLLQMWVKTE